MRYTIVTVRLVTSRHVKHFSPIFAVGRGSDGRRQRLSSQVGKPFPQRRGGEQGPVPGSVTAPSPSVVPLVGALLGPERSRQGELSPGRAAER